MTEDRQKTLGWLIGAGVIVAALGLYLLLTTPGVDLLSETYSVM